MASLQLLYRALPALLACLVLEAGCTTPRVVKVTPGGGVPVSKQAGPLFPARKKGQPDLPPELQKLIEESKSEAKHGFRFLPGDKVEIVVFGYADLRTVIRLPRDLTVGFPHIGSVDFSSKTIRELELEIRARLENGHLHEAQVSILPTEFAERTVFITGNVKKSGAYPIPPFGYLTLVQLISLAGGFDADADQDRILLTRVRDDGTSETFRISYTTIEREGNLDLDIFLRSGDRLLVPSQQKVYVLGSVNRPGGFSIGTEGLTASKAVALAQGFTRLAAPNSTVVIRVGTEGKKTAFRVPLSTILDAGSEELDLELEPGDVVFVPESLF